MNEAQLSKSDLGSVVMPLVNLLTVSNMSWSDRQAIACAIRATTRHHDSMEGERQKMGMAQAVGQIIGASAAGQINQVRSLT